MTARKKPTPAPPPDGRPSVAERVAVIRRRMVARTWSPDQTEELAEEWGVSLVLVRAHASEASRQIEAMADPSQVKAALDGLLLEAADAARQEEKPADRARALCQVVREGRELAGIGAHRDARNDPKTTAQPEPKPAETPFWLRPKAKTSKEGDPS
jgi:hypothetical protein